MTKVMIFIDGTWLYSNQSILTQKYGENFRLDYGKLPLLLGKEISKALGDKEVDIVRTYLFGSNAVNYDPRDEHLVRQREDFFNLLKEEYHYEVEIYPINYRGNRLRKKDRPKDSDFHPQEKCVDIALATNMFYFAAIPYAYDICIAVLGDRDFMPSLKQIRRLGKRVAIASIKESCASEYSDPKDEHRLKDFDIIWLDDHLDKLELKIIKRRIECQSEFHIGDRFVYTDELIRKGQKFYCKECKEKFKKDKQEQLIKFSHSISEEIDINKTKNQKGKIKKIVYDRGFGFIKNELGDFYFHVTDISDNKKFKEIINDEEVIFDIEIMPDRDNKEKPNGKASNIRFIQ